MPNQADDSFDVFAVVRTVQTGAACAAHPTEATRPNYKPPFLHTFVSDSGSLPAEASVLQQVGRAELQDDGSYRIHLTDEIPPTNLLILKPKRAESETK
jgi:hypothetical protein